MSRPSFVFILTDTQGASVVGAYGRPELRTPEIDRLAAGGIRFQRAYTACPVCTPARAAMFTGIYPHTAGAWTNNLPLGSNVRTMGERFQAAGYLTAYTGKWHLDGHDYFGTGICPPGWDPAYWYDGANYLAELSEEEIGLWRRGLNGIEPLRAYDIHAEFTWAHRVSDRAIRFLEEAADGQPFLLVVSYDEPHHPFICPPEYAEAFREYAYPVGPAAFDSLADKPAHQREWAAAANLPPADGTFRHPLYFGCNSFVDSEIGRVVAAVARLAPEDTVVIFTSDHGDMLTAHRLTGKGAAMYEEITHVPLVIRLPRGQGAGAVCSTPVGHADLLPTMLELAGLPLPPILEGHSLVSLLPAPTPSRSRDGAPLPAGVGAEEERSVFMEFNRYEIEHDSFGGFQPIRCIVRGRYKLVINLLTSDELYDLEADPAEVRNLIEDGEHGAARDRLHDALLDWMYEKRDPFRGYYWERRPWRAARQLGWTGRFRPRPADGFAPVVREYDTGLSAAGVSK
jgi:uncharacterized sulfatase